MKGVLRAILDNPLAMLLVVVAIIVTGVYAALHMKVDLFPNLDVPVVNIITHYLGAAPEDLELLVTRPIEDQMRGIPGVKRVASISAQGISQVSVEFGWGITVQDARQSVQSRLARVRSILPPGVDPRIEHIATTLQEVVGYVVYGGGDPIALRNTLRLDVVNRLMAVEGVSSVEVLGGEQRAFIVRIKPETLSRVHLTANDLVSVLKRNNLTAVAGYVDRGSREYLIRGDARLRTADDIRSLPVDVNGARTVLLGSIASISEGRVPRHYVVHGDGIPAVALVVRKQPGASTIRVAREVDAAIQELLGALPPGAQVKKYYDQSEIIAEARDEIFHDLLLGGVLAVLVLYFFLGSLRPTLIVAATIPLTLLATLTLMQFLGLGLNVITMPALALGVGMFVDDAIVVSENIFRHRQMGQDAWRASFDGSVEIAGADASGTFTTVAAFLPLVLITGLAALFLKPFGLTISSGLVVSLALSLTFVPVLFSRGGPVSRHTGSWGARLLGSLDAALQVMLKFSFRHRWLTLALAALCLSVGALAPFLGKTSMLPPIDEGAILIEYVMPAGTALSESNRIGDVLERIALAYPDVSCVYRRTGSPERGYQIEGVNKGELMIKLKPKTQRKRSVVEFMEALKSAYSRIKGVVFLYHQPTQEKIDESFSGLPAFFGVTIYGDNMDTLMSLADDAERILAKDPAVSNVVNNTKIKAPEILVRMDYQRLAQYGVSAADVMTALQAARFGIEATRIVRQREDVSILVKTAVGEAEEVGSIGQLLVNTGRGGLIPLDRVAHVRIVHAPPSITRLNGEREITLLAEVDGSIPSLVSRMRERLRSIQWPEGYRSDFTGQYKVLAQTLREMIFVLVSAVFLIYLIMAMQFRCGLQPLVILVTIPFSLIGALVALLISGHGLDVSVGMGVVTLVGISVNNAIVLLDYANKHAAHGTEVREALLSAASVRLRPILMTALTTIFALIPAAIGTTAGSRIFQPFAVTVIGGLMSGTIATLVIIPTLGTMVSARKRSKMKELPGMR